ncbi:hypothetical protein HQ571_02790 [Candidatus Kuenenbacteria bacterium]|nr:hypothetical protein [Candidatus Kuenenbacteria bacterium]
MKRWIIVGGLIIVVIVVNVIFWQWTGKDNNDAQVVVDELKEWDEFEDKDLVRFEVPKNYIIKYSPSGDVYWFNSFEDENPLIYQKVFRDEEISLVDQARKNIFATDECYNLSAVSDLSLFRNCQHLDSEFTFAFFEKNELLVILSINHKYFSEEEVDFIVNSVVIK